MGTKSYTEPLIYKVPIDGFGPRGAPECYYTSRVLNSTARYEQFVKKLRASEKAIKLNEDHDREVEQYQRNLDFFNRCDRRSLMNRLKVRFDLCLQSYEEDLKVKRQKLIILLNADEEKDMRKFVQDVYNGREAGWVATKERLAILLDKRDKEYQENYKLKDISSSKFVHALPNINKQRAKEAENMCWQQIQAKKMQELTEKEIDNMWHSVLMKETEALTARFEYETINRYHRNAEAKRHADLQLAARRMERTRQQEKLKQETLRMTAKYEEDRLKEEEEKRQLRENRQKRIKDIIDMIKERRETVNRQKTSAKVVGDAWASLTGQGLVDEKIQKERRKQQDRDMVECNLRLAEQKRHMAKQKYDNVPLILEEYERREGAAQLKRDQLLEQSRKNDLENGAAIVDQIKEKELTRKKNAYDIGLDYRRQVSDQLEQLVKHKELTDKQAKMMFYKDLLGQVEYKKLLQERARRETEEQTKKCQIVTKEYEDLVNLYRPSFAHEHPSMRQISRMSKKKNM